MKHIKSLRLFESTQELTEGQMYFLDRHSRGKWGVNPSTGLVDIMGHFNCFMEKLSGFQGIKFGEISGDFLCQNNQITSLEGSPNKVYGDFDCSDNSLTSLEGAPEEVGGNFDCDHNSLTSLKGAPKKVDGNFGCNYNTLVSLEGAPKVILKQFSCDAFWLDSRTWNPQGWLKILEEGTEKAKKLILTLSYLGPEPLQREIENNPGKWVMILREIWNSEEFRPLRDQLKLSDQFLNDIGDQSTLSDLGF